MKREEDDQVSEREHKLISTRTTIVDFLLSNEFPRLVPFFDSAITDCYPKDEDFGHLKHNGCLFHFSPMNCISFICRNNQ